MVGRQISTRSAAAALLFWLLLVVAVMAWRQPRFWDEPHERYRRAETLARAGRAADALAVVDDALAARPGDTGFLVFKGHRQLELRQPAEAERTFRTALARDPSNLDASLGLAAARALQGARGAALRTLQALPAGALAPSQLRRRSQLYGSLDAPLLALEDLAQLLHEQPDNPELLREATLHARAIRDWSRAATLALRLSVATSDPRVREWANETRGEALDAAGAPVEPFLAVEHYRELVRLRPREPHLRRTLAHALQAAGRRDEAEQVFRTLLAESAADRETRIVYAWMLNTERRYAEAWNVIEPLPRPDPDLEVLELQARTALWAGRPHDAVQLVSALVALRPHRGELWKRLAEAWQGIGDETQAAAALAVYLRVNAQDADARRQLADMLAASQSVRGAIEHYAALVAGEPGNPALLRRLGLLHETAGELEAAKAAYREAIELPGHDAADLYLRLGRLHRWTSEPIEAVRWYEKHIAREGDEVLRAQAESELALALLEAGETERSLAQLNSAAARRGLDAGELLVAARAATAMGDAAAAAAFLSRLAAQRPLTIDEERWLAGMYRAAGRPGEALAAYLGVASRTRSPDAGIFEAIGDLRADAGDFAGALDAYDKAAGAPSVPLKRARALARLGRTGEARAAYLHHLRLHAGDVDARLEAARQEAASGSPRAAIEHYGGVVAARGPADLRLELARAYLAAERYRDAEHWARQALAAGEQPDEARLALAQSLHLQGRVRLAENVLASGPAPVGEALVWRSRMATALDRHLDAYRAAEGALAAGATPRDHILLRMSAAARRRGDYGRAQAALDALTADDGAGPGIGEARRQLRVDTAPAIEGPAWLLRDSNDLLLSSTGGRLVLFLPSRRASVALGASTGTVSQRSFASRRTGASVALTHLFPVPELELALGAAVDQYDRAPDLFGWRAQATYFRRGGSTAGLSIAREALLTTGDALRQFNRVLDVGALGPGFHVHALRGFVDAVADAARRLRIELGYDALEDDNRRVSSYVHYQIPLSTGARRWVAIRPNLYIESFRERRPAYFSPDRHLTAGMMLHGIRRHPRWHVELELNPQWLRTSGANGFGVHGLLGAGATVGRLSLSAGAFVFYDGLEDYLQGRAAARIGIAIGRR